MRKRREGDEEKGGKRERKKKRNEEIEEEEPSAGINSLVTLSTSFVTASSLFPSPTRSESFVVFARAVAAGRRSIFGMRKKEKGKTERETASSLSTNETEAGDPKRA